MTAHRRLLVFIPACFVVAAACYGGGGAESPPVSSDGTAEEAPADRDISVGPVLLDSGPDKKYGILILPPNALLYHEGRYLDGEVILSVLYTDEIVAIPEDWVTFRCTDESLRFTAVGEVLSYVYQSDRGWSVFFEVPADYARGCPFMERFLQRFRYFKSVAGPAATSVPFPAVVEIR